MSARPLVVKELKALALPWLACLAGMIGFPLVSGEFRGLGIVAYFLGATAIGALSIGHEYTHRTISLLMAQPVERRRILVTKLSVVAAMLSVAAAIASVTVFNTTSPIEFGNGPERLAAIVVPLMCGLTWAPFLTMACRSPVAGAIFAGSIPGMLLVAAELVGVKVLGVADIDAFKFAVFVRGMPVLCALAAVMTWRGFMRLEAIEGRGADVRLPRWLRLGTRDRGDSPNRQHPIWLLMKKEIRLQPMTLTLAGLYVVGWAVACLWPAGHHALEILQVMTVFYSVSVALLIGANASAEERQLGTLPSQLLVPVAVSTQWAVKVTVALALSLAVTIGLPALLAAISPAIDGVIPSPGHLIWPRTLLSVLFTIAGLYVSSLSTSGLRAVMASWPALLAGGWLAGRLVRALGTPATSALERLLRLPTSSPFNGMCCGSPFPSALDTRLLDTVALVLTAGVLLVALRFAMANHRSTDRAVPRIGRQMIWMAGGLTVCLVTLAAVDAAQRDANRAANDPHGTRTAGAARAAAPR